MMEPVGRLIASDPTGGEIEHKALLRVHRGIVLAAVEDHESFHRSVPHAPVAIDKLLQGADGAGTPSAR